MSSDAASVERVRDYADFMSAEQIARHWDLAVTAVKDAIRDGHLKARVVGKTALVEYGAAVEWIRMHPFKLTKKEQTA